MDSFELADVLADHSRSDRLYYEFFRAPALSLGLYVLPAGAADPQSPHTEDEVYYVVNGSGLGQMTGGPINSAFHFFGDEMERLAGVK